MAEYSQRLIDKHGLEAFNELMAISRRPKQWDANELKKLIAAIKESHQKFLQEYAEIRAKI